MARRLVVIGAGPIGLEAALLGTERGFDVTVLEAGLPGESLRRWGPTRFFSPFGMNVSARTKKILGAGAPPDSAILTGSEFVETVLARIASHLGDRVKTEHRVVSIGRARMLRSDFAGNPLRHARPFRVLAETVRGEIALDADAVLDASGCSSLPVFLGPGGMPAIGERILGSRILRDLGTLHRRLAELAGRRILLLGAGHSAANALAALSTLAARAPATRVVHAVRSLNTRPFVEVASDPLSEREGIVSRANALDAAPPSWLRVERRAQVESIRETSSGLEVSLGGGTEVVVDEIVALVGQRPDLSIESELALEISPATEGAARLSAALANVTDCLSIPAVTPADLASGEPGFHLAGQKSYGRARTFLLQTGLAQLETIFSELK